MPAVSLPLCTDEQVAIRAGGDFAALCPIDQSLASGADGALAAGSWVMTSASIGDWSAKGVAPGMVVQLKSSGAASLPPVGNLIVDVVSTTSLTLRRKGFASGVGMPPGGAAGLSSVTFLIASLSPQIDRASYDLYRRYGIDDLVAGRRTQDFYDAQEVQESCVLEVLWRLYLDAWRNSQNDTFKLKYAAMKAELDTLLDRVAIHFRPISSTGGTGNVGEVTSRFSTRLSR